MFCFMYLYSMLELHNCLTVMKISSGASLMLLLFSVVVAVPAGRNTFTFTGSGTESVAANGTRTITFTGSGTGTRGSLANDPTPGDSSWRALKARDCSDVLAANSSARSGVYTITPSVGSGSIDVYCDMTNNGGGWTVIQRRSDGSEDFIRSWDDYKKGFGSLENEFWLGNENIYRITNQHGYSIRFDLEDFTRGKRYAVYYHFYIDGEDEKYRLHIQGYTGDAGEAMTTRHNEMAFSTKDQDNDKTSGHCSQQYLGGWWYRDCHYVNLNGQYNNTAKAKGINWYPFNGYYASLKRTTMKIRP